MSGLLTGFSTFVWQVLTARRTLLILLLWLGAGAVLGRLSAPGEHPAEGLLLHVPGALLPFAFWARFGLRDRAAALLGAGVAVALIGTLVAGGGFGSMTCDPTGSTESYNRPGVGRPVPVHLGGVLGVQADDESHVALRLAAGAVEMGLARVSLLDGREQTLGPWQVRYLKSVVGEAPSRVRVHATAEGQPPQDLLFRQGQQVRLPDATVVALTNLAADYGQGLGPAAELTITGENYHRADWYFVDAPDLDARLGTGKWRFEVQAIDPAQTIVVDVHHHGIPWAVAAGWAMVLAALVWAGTRRTEAVA